jgi:hypothetical protein
MIWRVRASASWGELALAGSVDRKTTAEFLAASVFSARIIHTKPIKMAFSGELNEVKGLTTRYV